MLAANSPLSLQAHPTPQRVRAGFERENAAGVPIAAPTLNYRDPFQKPELVVAVSEHFDALCGFRPPAEVREILDRLRHLNQQPTHPRPELLEELDRRLTGDDGLRETVGGSSAEAMGRPNRRAHRAARGVIGPRRCVDGT